MGRRRRRPRRVGAIRSGRRRRAAALAAAGIALGLAAAAAGAHAASVHPWRLVTVAPGDTLWQLSRRYAPASEDPRRWIFDVEALNGMPGAAIVPGEVLRVPIR